MDQGNGGNGPGVTEGGQPLAMGIIEWLEKLPGACDIRLADKKPADRSLLVAWEQRHSCTLPDDLRQFYLSSNGFHLQWSVNHAGSILKLGMLYVNSVEKLTKLGQFDSHGIDLTELQSDDDSNEAGHEEVIFKPDFGDKCRIFEFDSCGGDGKVCLVYKNTKPGVPASICDIWFLDCSLRWHYMTSSFIAYYRLMMMHLGLPHWQYLFTDIGLHASAKQWFHMFAPVRLSVDEELFFSQHSLTEENTARHQGEEPRVNKLDINKLFTGKSDKKARGGPNPTKKKPQTAARNATSKSCHTAVKGAKPLM